MQEVGIKAEFDIATMVKSVGNVKLTEKQRKILFLEVPEEQVEIRADGIVYLPHIFLPVCNIIPRIGHGSLLHS